jgi:hypothetical protein
MTGTNRSSIQLVAWGTFGSRLLTNDDWRQGPAPFPRIRWKECQEAEWGATGKSSTRTIVIRGMTRRSNLQPV